jgi:hypothetical protein
MEDTTVRSRLTQLIVAGLLSAGVGIASAGEAPSTSSTPSILGSTQEYKAMSDQEMTRVKGESFLCDCIALPPIKVKAKVYVYASVG